MSQKVSMYQLGNYREQLVDLLSGELDFHGISSRDFTHDLHAFPAKFPPQIPRVFIESLTGTDDLVLDPMAGSGTTLLEAAVAGRRSLGFDIDPLALRVCRTKTVRPSPGQTAHAGIQVHRKVSPETIDLLTEKRSRFDEKTLEFVDYWFHEDAQRELLALLVEIEKVDDPAIRHFLELVFSSIIITKSGGVSLAYDLAHTRPHKVKDKPYRSPIVEFEKRLKRSLKSLSDLPRDVVPSSVALGDSQSLPLADYTVDLIVTSPPYPANAIDYMRAHKFSLVWFGYSISSLSALRREYIGSEATTGQTFEVLPDYTSDIINQLASQDKKRAAVLTRYYSEMTRVLREMYRVVKPGKAAVLVVGSSNLRGIDTQVATCLAEIGSDIGFDIPHIGVRNLDRDRRMMPFRRKPQDSQIEKRMHQEHVIGFYKASSNELVETHHVDLALVT